MVLAERIQKILDYADMNPSQFARRVGFPTPQTVRELLKGNTKTVSDAVKFKIYNTFPEINLEWLVSGEGDMFASEPDPTSDMYEEWERTHKAVKPSNHTTNGLETQYEKSETNEGDYIPLLPVEAIAGSLQGFSEGVELANCRKIKSPVNGADWAIQISGDSMEPDYKNGSYLFIKKLSGGMMMWGYPMVVDTLDGVVFKQIHQIEGDSEAVEARSINPKYPNFQIKKSIILGFYRVLGGTFINSTI